MKRALIYCSVKDASGSQTFRVDVPDDATEADAMEAFESGDGDIHLHDVEVTDLEAAVFDSWTTTDDYGDFPPEQARAQQPSAEPVGYFCNDAAIGDRPHWSQVSDDCRNDPDVFPLYARPAADVLADAARWKFVRESEGYAVVRLGECYDVGSSGVGQEFETLDDAAIDAARERR